MKPLDLIESANILVEAGRGKLSQARLRRATSSAYYAMFHCLARNCADCFVGGTGADRSKSAWRDTYRALDHEPSKRACTNAIVTKFPKAIEDFANFYVAFQGKRHSADYDPFIRLKKSEVLKNVENAKNAIKAFESASIKDRRAFAAHVLFKKRQP